LTCTRTSLALQSIYNGNFRRVKEFQLTVQIRTGDFPYDYAFKQQQLVWSPDVAGSFVRAAFPMLEVSALLSVPSGVLRQNPPPSEKSPKIGK
jgi:hypothetical protein